MFYNSYQGAAAALEKISGILEEQPSVPDPTRPIALWQARGRVRFDGVEFAYAEARVVLPRFDLDIPAGSSLAIVGLTFALIRRLAGEGVAHRLLAAGGGGLR